MRNREATVTIQVKVPFGGVYENIFVLISIREPIKVIGFFSEKDHDLIITDVVAFSEGDAFLQ